MIDADQMQFMDEVAQRAVCTYVSKGLSNSEAVRAAYALAHDLWNERSHVFALTRKVSASTRKGGI